MPAREESLPALALRTVEDAKEVARAEVALVKARATAKVAHYRMPVILFAVAGVLMLAALPALLVGLILALATVVGPGWATAIVIGVTVLLAGGLAAFASSRLKAQ